MNSRSNRLRIRSICGLGMMSLLICLLGSGIALGQKRPSSLDQGTTPDDKKLCKVLTADAKKSGEALETWLNDESDFCTYYKEYFTFMDSEPAKARKARNRMIDLVQSQIEVYYKDRKDNRKKHVAIIQTVLDILEIGTAAATGIIKGTLRAKSVIAQSLSGFQAGRTAFNKNTNILQTQVLINKMRSNRAEIALSIESKKALNVDDYSWYSAKLDLIKLLNAGTFNDALETLVKDSGDQAADSEKALAELKQRHGIVGRPSDTTIKINAKAADLISSLNKAYTDAAGTAAEIQETQQKVLKKYQNTYSAIKANDSLFARFNKIPDDPDYDAGDKSELRRIIGELAVDPTKVEADDYDFVLGAFLDQVVSHTTLGPAYLQILEDNK